jgi:pimeloyl-ACP methyl ester carboxylesterase
LACKIPRYDVLSKYLGDMSMSEKRNYNRRHFLSQAGMTIAGSQLAVMGAANAQTHTSFSSIKQINAGPLSIGYAEVGPAHGQAVVLIHGWPYDIHSYVDVAPILASKGYRVIVPYLRGYGPTRFLSSSTFRNGQQSVVALDIINLMNALNVKSAVIGGFDWGSRTGNIIAALWPKRCKALVAVSGYLITNVKAQAQPLPPKAELGWWYQYYFSTERGRIGYAKYTNDFNRLIWKTVSPKWSFSEATFDRTAASFANPDHVAIVVHNYRWRIGLAKGDPQYDGLESRLFQGPGISVPTITIASDFDGPAKSGAPYRSKYTGKYEHRIFNGIGHNVPQEAPQAFAKAIVDVDHFSAAR